MIPMGLVLKIADTSIAYASMLILCGMSEIVRVRDLVTIKEQPELGVWRCCRFQDDYPYGWVWVKPYSDVPDGLASLADGGTIAVSTRVLSPYKPNQQETLI